jgi:flagellar hook-associated protein 1 FlgK
MNQQIYDQEGAFAGQPPNDLLDKRDEAIRQLSELVTVSVVKQDDGMLNVFIGNGQGLVIGNQSAALSTMQDPFDPEVLDVGYSFGGGTVANISEKITGGKLGGVIEFRDVLLKSSTDDLGRVALGLSEEFNAQHQLGLDKNNVLGGNFFNDLSIQTAVASLNNNVATNITFTGTVTSVGALKASDYRIDFAGGLYTVTRVSDNTVVSSSAVAAVDLTATEGFSIAAATVTAPVSGDSFMLRFTAPATQKFGVAISQTSLIALAGPLRSSATLTNVGSGAITSGDVSNVTNLPLGAPITLTYSPNALGAGVPGFTVTNGPGGTLAYNPATESSGKTFTFAAYGGYSFSISGVPSNADTFTIGNNTNAASDNRNALKLGSLQNTPTLINGAAGPTASFQGAYSKLVADVGARTHQADIDQQAQQSMLDQAIEMQSNVAGVNLDEEAANLVRYQQAYQASAQLISTAQSVFTTLLSAIRG